MLDVEVKCLFINNKRLRVKIRASENYFKIYGQTGPVAKLHYDVVSLQLSFIVG